MRPTLILAALLVFATIAGCFQAAPTATLPPAPAPRTIGNVTTMGVVHGPNGTLLPDGVTMPQALGGGFHIGGFADEPTLGIDAKGNVYVAGIANDQFGGGTVFKSADKGQTWKDVGPKLPTGGATHVQSFDPFLYVDVDTGRVFSDDIWPLGCGAAAWSDDQGATWTNNPASCGNPNVNDHQSLVTGKPRQLPTQLYPKVVYRCVNNLGDSACATSLDGGLTWGPQLVAMKGVEVGSGDAPSPTVCGGLTGHLAAAPDGTVYLPRGGCGWADVAVTQDDGITWTTYVIDKQHPTDDHEVRIGVDEKGVAYAAWNSAGHLWMAYSSDAGKTWTPAIDITAPGVSATYFNAVGAGAPGRVAIAYLGSTTPGGYDNKNATEDWKGTTWNAYLTLIVNASSDAPILQSVTANDPTDPLARDECGRTRCNGMYDFIDVHVDSDGRPWASFQDVCTKECRTDPSKPFDTREGLVATILSGPALRGATTELAAIQPEHAKGT
jgi:hypothetical protein